MSHSGTWLLCTGGCVMEEGLTHRDLVVISTGGCVREGGGYHTVGPGCSLQLGV